MNRVLITGVSGFTGRYLTRELQKFGYEVHGLVRSLGSAPECDYFYKSDLDDADALLQIIERVQPRYVVHLAAISFVAHSNPDEIYRVNFLGTRHLLEALSRSAVKPDAVLLSSSANIYGSSKAQYLVENSFPSPTNDYAISKLAMEYVAGLYREQLPLIIVRPFNYTGVGQPISFLIPKIINHFQRKSPVIELGNLDVARDFSDVRAVVEVYRRLLETPAAIGSIFNVCSGSTYTLQQILQMSRDISGQNLDVHVNPDFVRVNEVKILSGSNAKLREVLGRLPCIKMEHTLRWMLSNR